MYLRYLSNKVDSRFGSMRFDSNTLLLTFSDYRQDKTTSHKRKVYRNKKADLYYVIFEGEKFRVTNSLLPLDLSHEITPHCFN